MSGWMALGVGMPAPASASLLDNGLRLEGERMLRPGMWRLAAIYGVESHIKPGRETVTGQQIDITTMRMPLSWRYGFSQRVELGVDMQFEQNKGVDFGDAKVYDANGISYMDVVAKYKFLPWGTFLGHIGMYADKELYMGGDQNDIGVDILLTLPLNLPIGVPNLMHFNTGIRLKGGHPDIDANKIRDQKGYSDPIHLGWSLIVAPWPKWSVIGEIFVRRSPFDLEEEVEMSLGSRFAFTDRTNWQASLTHGVSGGSPDWAVRFGIQTTYGSLTERQVAKAEGRGREPREIPAEGGIDAPPPLEISVNRLTSLAEAAYNRGDYLAAADAFAELVSRLPSEGRIYYNLGVCYFNLKDYTRAEGDFLKAKTLMANDAEIHLYLGHCQYMQGRVGEARKNWEEVVRLDPNNELARFLLKTSR